MADTLKSLIRSAAKRLGFGRVGFAAAGPVPHADHFGDWLEAGSNGSMGWFERSPEVRKDIRNRNPWAKTFVVISMDYASKLPEKLPKKSALPNIARYARALDYHDIYKPALKSLQDEILKIGGPESKALWYQDTGPFLEREIAQQAGLGWVGKNTMLINSEHGSWTFLALIVTSLELEPDAPATDHCGHCTKCLDACPTDAFPEPYKMDSKRCISYLTIEHKGPIAEKFRTGIGELLYGCDICNEVCPWNSKAPDIEPEVPEDLAGLTLARLFTGKEDHLKKRLEGTPLLRTGEARLKRNAAINAGNMRDDALLPSLDQAMKHTDPMVREAVIWALKRYGNKQARGVLARAQRHETDDGVRDQIIEALQNWPSE
ncbi:tRNA epoxyqueuosine(34) reductase QueG [Planctomycetota bacterium]|nr:tRNA epoxyqueuosine(34) reductase QueG [Planctomycetota bacterium]